MDSDFKPIRRPVKPLRQTLDQRGAIGQKPNDENFRTPAEVAADDDVDLRVDMPEQISEQPPKPKPWRQKLKLNWPPGRKEYAVVAVVLLLLGGGVFALTQDSNPVATVTKKVKQAVKPAAPKTVASKLSGLQVEPAINERPVTGIMIENSMAARPQAGLGEAGVVFEAIAEYGITRFLALYQDTTPGDVGPIRSARPYYVDWALGFDAGYAHVGGSPDALAAIKAKSVKDLDQFGASGSYHRVGHRAAPHNVYTSLDALIKLQQSRGYNTSTFEGFPRKKPLASKKPPTARVIDIAISGPAYNVHYDYDAAKNTYARSEGGTPHIDANTNNQLSPSVVIAIAVPYSLAADGYHSQYQTVGSGVARIFQDGTVTEAIWTKTGDRSQLVFTTPDSKPVKLNPGQTWITAVSDLVLVTSAP